MSRSNGRTAPFPGFSRGLPIIGEGPAKLPEGRYYYEVPCFIQWADQALRTDSFEIYFPAPLDGALYKEIPGIIRSHLIAVHPDHNPAGLRVTPFSPYFLGFVPKEEIERLEAEAAEKARASEVAIQ